MRSLVGKVSYSDFMGGLTLPTVFYDVCSDGGVSEAGSGAEVRFIAFSILIQTGLYRIASLLLQDYPEALLTLRFLSRRLQEFGMGKR